jgi:hypothetical protein
MVVLRGKIQKARPSSSGQAATQVGAGPWDLWRILAATLFVLGIPLVGWTGEEKGGAKETMEVQEIHTLASLRPKGLTRFVGKEFRLRQALVWEYAMVRIPEDPGPKDGVLEAGPLKIAFDGPEFKDIQGRKALFARGAGLSKKAGKDGREHYFFKETGLDSGQVYDMKVRLLLRPGFKEEMLKDPAFVAQSDNPRYWAQTFEFELLDLAPPPAEGR